ncbi:MAG: AI-2E family transporter [Bacteroidetes bacterium]|nr:AI-2E family transporter [Bacteroidota bacterium]
MKPTLPSYIKIVVILIGITLAVFLMIEAKSLLVPILISGLLAVLISPFTSWLEKNKFPRYLAVSLSLIALLVLIGLLLFFFYNQVLSFAKDISFLERRTTELINEINALIEKYSDAAIPLSMSQMKDVVFEYITENMSSLTRGKMATASTLTMLFIIPVYIYLFLYYRHFLISFLLKAFGENNHDRVNNAVHKIRQVIKNYVKGMFLVIIILAILNTATLYAFGIKHALLFGVFAAMLNVIPFLGPILGSALPIVYALLTKDSLWYPVGILISFYVIQLFESNLFTPKIVGGKVSMNPLMTIFALFIGNFIWGLAGMILFIPGLAILKVVFDEIPGMEPYGYLLGNVNEEKKEKRRRIVEEKIKQVSAKIKKAGRKS